jgi:hypothetical protein
MDPRVLTLVTDRMAPPGREGEGLGDGVELEGVPAEATFDVPFICLARAANAAEERAEDSSELIDNTIPASTQ